MIAKENLAFTKMESICKLGERHGTNLGSGYKIDQCLLNLQHLKALFQQLTSVIFQLTLQADCTTDCGNIENDLFMIFYLDPYCMDGQVHIRIKFLTARYCKSGTVEGLYDAVRCKFKVNGPRGIIG